MFKFFYKYKYKKNTKKLRFFLILFTLSSSIFASMPNEKISITSDKLEISFANKQVELIFSDNVRVNSLSFNAQCANAKITIHGNLQNLSNLQDFTSNTDVIKQIFITGPLTLQQENRNCKADFAKIIPSKSSIELLGNVHVDDSMGKISGHKISINYTTKKIEISGKSDESTKNKDDLTVKIEIDTTSIPQEKNINPIIYPNMLEKHNITNIKNMTTLRNFNKILKDFSERNPLIQNKIYPLQNKIL